MLRIAPMTGTREPGPREEREGNRKTIVQGMPGCFGVPVVTNLVCFHLFAHKAAGAARHPAFPAPSVVGRYGKARADRAAGMRTYVCSRNLEEKRVACGPHGGRRVSGAALGSNPRSREATRPREARKPKLPVQPQEITVSGYCQDLFWSWRLCWTHRKAGGCVTALETGDNVLISAGTVAEALVVAARRNVKGEMELLIGGLGFEIVSVTSTSARRVAQAYESWGRGVHPGGLNFGDCFACEVARERGCRLLFVGEDFRQTDVQGAF